MDKKGNIVKMLVVVLCLCAVTLFALVQSGTNIPFIQAYKNNFKQNITGICNMLGITLPIEMQLYLDDMSTPTPKPTMMPASEQAELEKALGYMESEEVIPHEGTAELTTKEPVKVSSGDALPIALDAAENARFADYKGDIVSANETRYRAFNKNGELMWELPIQMQDPQLTVKGSYVLINETGAKKVSLYEGKKLLFTASTEGNIITADLSKNGDVVAVTEKEYFKGQVVVFNKSGKIVFAWDSGSYNILDAAISAKRSVAVSLLNTDEGADSFITCFGVDGKTKYKTENFKNSIIFDLEYNGEKLNAFSDSMCVGISAKGKTLWEYGFDGKLLTNYQMASNGSKLLLFESSGTGEIVVLSANGKTYTPIKTEVMPDSVSIKSDYVAYNSGRDVIITDFNGKRMLRAVCDSDIKEVYAIAPKKAFCVYSSSIQFKKLTRQEKHDTVSIPMQSEMPQDGQQEGEE
ncbi:MAG: hypothetical protein J6C82_00075 [Clostridia bacterium]|nr:hypothetical protein [Clostridia bacterium]